MPRLRPLHDQSIVVTGATSGNGLATVERACRKGAAVVAVARNRPALEALRDRLHADGARVAICAADISDPASADRIVAVAIEAFGGFDSWINNAAVAVYGTLEQIPLADHRRVFDVNYFGMLQGSLAAARHLRERGGGSIVNVGSILSDRTIIEQGPYSAAKHAVEALTETLRMELERDGVGISVTLIKPGAIDTPFPDHARNYMAVPPRLPQPVYTPDIVADAVLFACSHPRRTLYAGGGGWLGSFLARAAPRLTDIIMEKVGARLQQSPSKPGDPARRDNLYEARVDALRGSQNVAARRHSLIVQLQKMPLAIMPIAAAAAGIAVFFAMRRETNPTSPGSARHVENNGDIG